MAGVTRRDFIHRMSSTLAVVATTIRSVGVTAASGLTVPEMAGMSWMHDAFAENGEFHILRELGLSALAEGRGDDAFDYLLSAASLVDAEDRQYRIGLDAFRAVCIATGRERAVTTLDWYTGATTLPRDVFDAGCARVARGEFVAAAITFDRTSLTAHAAAALERGGMRVAAREHYSRLAAERAGLPRALAVLRAAVLSTDGPARDRAVRAATEAAHAALSDLVRERVRWDVATASELRDALDQRMFFETQWVPSSRSANADRFRFTVAPPWIEPMLDDDTRNDVPALCGGLLLSRPACERRVSARAADFFLRRVLVTRLLALETPDDADTRERAQLLRTSLSLRLQQLGDRRFRARIAQLAALPDRACGLSGRALTLPNDVSIGAEA